MAQARGSRIMAQGSWPMARGQEPSHGGKSWENLRKNGLNNYGDFGAKYGIILIKQGFECLKWIFLLHGKLIKCRFHGIRHRRLNIS